MKKHWFYIYEGQVLEGDADLYANRDHGNTLWDFDSYDNGGLRMECDLFETREEALRAAMAWCIDQINILECKLDDLEAELVLG